MRCFTLHWSSGYRTNRPYRVTGLNVADACRRAGLNSQILETLDHWNEEHVENEPNCQCSYACYTRNKKAAAN